MANHKSALKRIRSNNKKRLLNRFQHKTARNAIKKLREMTDKKEANKMFPYVISLIDKSKEKHHTRKQSGKLKVQVSEPCCFSLGIVRII